jgi:DNA-binding FrmR family transcriptional regulator
MRTVLLQLTAVQIAVDHTGDVLLRSLVAHFTLFRSDSSDLVVGAGHGLLR